MNHLRYAALAVTTGLAIIMACGSSKKQPKLGATHDLDVAKASAKFKYNKENVEEAKQGWKFGGTCPTAYDNFDQVPSFRIRAANEGEEDSIDHYFMRDSTGVLGRDGTRYRQKFFYFSSTRAEERSGDHKFPKYGLFKAWINDGECKFIYAITKANEGGMMVSTQYYGEIRDTMGESNKVKATAQIDAALELGDEVHQATRELKYTAKKKGVRAKLNKIK